MNMLIDSLARVVAHILETSWQAAVLAALVVLLSLLLGDRLSARWRCALWLIVVGRLLMPVAPESSVSLFNYLPRGLAAVEQPVAEDPISPTIDETSIAPAKIPPVEFANISDSATGMNTPIASATSDTKLAEPVDTATELSWSTARTVWFMVAAIWLAGMAVLVIRLLILWLRLHLLLRECRLVEDADVCRIFDAARRELNIRRRIRLLASPLKVGPAIADIFRPRMIFAESLFESLSADELRLIFLHELAHVRRHDLLVQRLWLLVEILHWFNPVVWLSARRWQADRELACDEAVLARLDRSHRADYGHAILRVMESLSTFRPVPGAVGVLMRRSFLPRRIAMIARYRPLSRRWTLLAAGLLLLLIPVGLTNAVDKSNMPAEPEPAAATADEKATDEDATAEDSEDSASDSLADDGTVSLAEAVRELNEQAAKLPESRTRKPLTEAEVVKAVGRLTRNERMPDAEYRTFKQIAETRRLPENVTLQQFVRYNDGVETQHGWWVRLILTREEQGPMSVTIRQKLLFRRPYTQKERLFWGELNDGVPTLNRLVAYFDEDPKFGTERTFSPQEAQRLAESVKAAFNAKNADDLLKAHHWKGVSLAPRAEVLAEAKRLVNLPLRSVSVRPRRFDGQLRHWQGLQFWTPNLPVLGYVVLQFADKGDPTSICLEFGENQGKARLVNYIVSQDDRRRLVGKPMSSPMRVQGFSVTDPAGKWLEYYAQIDAPDELAALRNANFELCRLAVAPRKDTTSSDAAKTTREATASHKPDKMRSSIITLQYLRADHAAALIRRLYVGDIKDARRQDHVQIGVDRERNQLVLRANEVYTTEIIAILARLDNPPPKTPPGPEEPTSPAPVDSPEAPTHGSDADRPVGSVQVEVVPDLDTIIIRGRPEDVKHVQRLIKELEASRSTSEDNKSTIAPRGAPSRDATKPAVAVNVGKTIAITGRCVDEKNQPLAGAEVVVFEFGNDVPGGRRKAAQATSDAKGEFRFDPLPTPFRNFSESKSLAYIVLAKKSGRASMGNYVSSHNLPLKRLRFKMPPAATLSGHVIDAEGKPVEGARVSSLGFSLGADGFFSARTDSEGRFEIDDLLEWNLRGSAVKLHPEGYGVTITGSYSPDDTEQSQAEQRSTHFAIMVPQMLVIRHPDYAAAPLKVEQLPSKVEVTLRPSAVVEGRVSDAATGKPLTGIHLLAKGTGKNGNYWVGEAKTDDQGRYRVDSLPAGEYNLQTQTLDRPNVGIKIEIQEGQTHSSVDLEFIEGGIIEGRIVDATTGKLLPEPYNKIKGMLGVMEQGKDKKGPATQMAQADENGRFRLHVLPGKNYPYIVDPYLWQGTAQREQIERDGIEVLPGETKIIELRVTPMKPTGPMPPNKKASEKTSKADEASGAATFVKSGQSGPTNISPSGGPQKKLLQSDAPLEVLIESLRSEDFNTRMRAVDFIGYRGEAAREAVPALVKALENDHMRESVLNALKAIGPGASAAIPALYNSITAYPKQPATRWIAAHALANIGKSAIPTLEKGAGSVNLYERIWCHAALAKGEGPASNHFQFLSDAMLSHDKTTSLVAVRALTMIGSDAKSVLPQIITAMDRQTTAKTDLAVLLAQMGKDASPAIPQLVVLLDHSNPMTRQRAAYALSRIGGAEVRPAVPRLIGMLTAKEGYVREMAATALGKIGSTAGLSIRPLIDRLEDEDEHTRAAAATALGEIAPTDATVLGALSKAMKDESGRVRSHVAPVLAKNAPVTREMINLFIVASEDNWKAVMMACRTFFSRLGPDDSELIPERYKGPAPRR